jgi:hypothetical protein
LLLLRDLRPDNKVAEDRVDNMSAGSAATAHSVSGDSFVGVDRHGDLSE